jgi:hypothetical protein
MGGDANVKLCIQHFLSPGLSPTLLGNLLKKMWPEIALNNSGIILPTKNYVDRPKTKSAIVLTKIILKICTFSIKKTMILQEKNNRCAIALTKIILKICTFSIKKHYFTRKKPSSKFRLIYCFFLVKSCFFIEKVHILRITHFSETTKDRNLIFDMGGDDNVKLCIQYFYP